MQGFLVLWAFLLWAARLCAFSVAHSIRVELLRSVENSVPITTNATSMMKPPLKSYEVASIVIGGFFIIFGCAVGGIVVFKVCSKKKCWRKLSRHRQPHNPTQQCQDEENVSLQVHIGDNNFLQEFVDDSTLPSNNDSQYQEMGYEDPECPAMHPVSPIEQSQPQENSVPSDETERIPGSLLIVHSESSTHTPDDRLQFEREDSGLTMLSPTSDELTNSSVLSRNCPNSETVLLRSTGDYQETSNELMFLGSVKSLVLDSHGGKFSIPEHDLTLSFPQGAVVDPIEIEVGVAIHGLFEFPDDLRPISVLVWVQAKTPDFEFKKPVEISLPHYLKLSKNDTHENSSNLGLGFMVTDGEEDGHHHLIFKEGAKEQVSYKQTRAIISTTHFCYMCLSAKTCVIAEKGCYLLTQVQLEPITPLRWQIHFCVSYNLCSFTEMIKQQYCSQGKIVSQKPLQFTPPPTGEKPELKIHYQPPMKGWQLTFPTYETIPQSAVELWDDDVSMLQNRVMLQLFPPRVTVEVSGEGAFGNTTQLFSLEGAHQRLKSEVHLCLSAERVAQHKNTLQYLESRHVNISRLDPPPLMRAMISQNSCPGNIISLRQYQAHPDEPTEQELFEVMKEIAKMGSNWCTLIGVLGIPDDKEQEILNDHKGLKEQIRSMLQTWKQLHRCDGTNTRANLAAILRKADPCLYSAVKILERHSQF